MTLAYVQAAVAAVMALIATLTGLLTVTALLLPRQTNKASFALNRSPWRCFWGGMGLLIVLIVGVICLSIANPILKVAGVLILVALAGVATVGASGLSLLLGQRIGEMSGARTSFGSLVRGSLAYSVGLMFPLIGWYVLAPISMISALGAGACALWPEVRFMPVRPVPAAETSGAQGAP